MNNLAELRDLEFQKDQLENEIFEMVRVTFPVGCMVHFFKGLGRVTARVIKHGYHGQLYICNIKTEKEYWIDYYELIK